MQPGESAVDGGVVSPDDLCAAPAVGLLDRRLDARDRLLGRQYPGGGEEARLENRVRAAGEARLAGDPACVDRVQLDPLGHDLLADRPGELPPHLVGLVRAVEEQRRAGRGAVEHLGPVEQLELMAADEARPAHQVGDRMGCGPNRRCDTVCEPDFFES